MNCTVTEYVLISVLPSFDHTNRHLNKRFNIFLDLPKLKTRLKIVNLRFDVLCKPVSYNACRTKKPTNTVNLLCWFLKYVIELMLVHKN